MTRKDGRSEGERLTDKLTVVAAILLIVVVGVAAVFTLKNGTDSMARTLGPLAGIGLLGVLAVSILIHVRRVLARDHDAVLAHIEDESNRTRGLLQGLHSGRITTMQALDDEVEEMEQATKEAPSYDSIDAILEASMKNSMHQAQKQVRQERDEDEDEDS